MCRIQPGMRCSVMGREESSNEQGEDSTYRDSHIQHVDGPDYGEMDENEECVGEEDSYSRHGSPRTRIRRRRNNK